ncbi:MAG: hypothetical protein ACSLE0_23380 [Chitinophagaceae bacterium]
MAVSNLAGQIIIASTSKAYTKATKTGKLNMGIIALYELIAYYAEYTKGREEFNNEHAYLLDKLTRMKYAHPDILCNYKGILQNTGGLTSASNTAPTVDDNCVDIGSDSSYQFTVGDFTVNYADAEGNPWKYLIIYIGTSSDGEIYTKSQTPPDFGTIPVRIDIEGKLPSETLNLYYTRGNSDIYGPDNFSFRISDNPTYYLYSSLHTICINATSTTDAFNSASDDVGDRTIYVANRAVTVFTLYDFTGGLTPPYNDPEGDLIDAIRIIDISNANDGIFYFNGIPIAVGDIIIREDINAGLFTHEAPNQDAINSDVFEFEARDEGSGIWVE